MNNALHLSSSPLSSPLSVRVKSLELPGRAGPEYESARAADRFILSKAPAGFLDTTHFDTVRFPPPAWASDAFAKAAADGALAYTGYRGNDEVLEAVGSSVGELLGITVDAKRQLILTPGTQAGLFGALACLVNPGDEVLLFDPDYLFSERILRFLGATVLSVALTQGAVIEPDLTVLEATLNRTRPKLLVFSHPNNPTGAVYAPAVLRKIAELAVKFDFTVLVDELYCQLVYETDYTHLVSLPGMRDRTVTLLGPSKTESLSGYRLGVVVAPEQVIAGIENIQSITSLRAPAYAQHVLKHWLTEDRNWLAERLQEFGKLRAMTAQAISAIPWAKWVPQQGTAYGWIDVRHLNLPDAVVARRLLEDAAVLVSPGYQFGSRGVGHFRVCYARDETEWMAALKKITKVLLELDEERKSLPEVQ